MIMLNVAIIMMMLNVHDNDDDDVQSYTMVDGKCGRGIQGGW